jgi:hypothetical protein
MWEGIHMLLVQNFKCRIEYKNRIVHRQSYADL